jgi:hypothetical protein
MTLMQRILFVVGRHAPAPPEAPKLRCECPIRPCWGWEEIADPASHSKCCPIRKAHDALAAAAGEATQYRPEGFGPR